MPRFEIRYNTPVTVTDGVPEKAKVLFKTDSLKTVRYWLYMSGEFIVHDIATKHDIRTEPALDASLKEVPIIEPDVYVGEE